MIFKLKNKKSNEKGFTLIEMIVSIAIFIVVAIVAIGALMRVIDANKKSQSLKTSINNLNFALESMSREMRVGSNYHCVSGSVNQQVGQGSTGLPDLGSSCDEDRDWTIYFYSSKKDTTPGSPCSSLIYAYRFKNDTIEKAEEKVCTETLNDNSFFPIISSDIKFTNARVEVSVNTNTHSTARFFLKGYTGANKERTKTNFSLQTTVSQRIAD